MILTPAIAWTAIAGLALAVIAVCLAVRRWPHDSTNDEDRHDD